MRPPSPSRAGTSTYLKWTSATGTLARVNEGGNAPDHGIWPERPFPVPDTSRVNTH